MSFKTGKNVFTSYKGTSYLLDKYLSPAEIDELKRLNDGFHDKRFEDFLLTRISSGAGSRFIPSNYNDEVVRYAQSKVGSNISTKSFKTISGDVDVLETYEGQKVFYDKNNRLRDYESGRFTKIQNK